MDVASNDVRVTVHSGPFEGTYEVGVGAPASIADWGVLIEPPPPFPNQSGITPVDLRVLVKPDPVEEKTAGGIWKPDASLDREKYAGTRATLIAHGPNAFKEWGSGNGIKPGSRVHYAQYSGARIKGEDQEDYVIMNDADLTCVIEGTGSQ